MRSSVGGSPRALGVSLFVALAIFASADSYGSNLTLQAAGFPLLSVTAQSQTLIPARVFPAADEVEPPSTHDRLVQLIQQAWPEDPDTAVRILICESHAGDDADTYDVDAANGGPMQLDRYTWQPYFETNYGWTWSQVVTDIHVHLQAARIIYDRARGWTPWSCG